jgi:hypothetical protein
MNLNIDTSTQRVLGKYASRHTLSCQLCIRHSRKVLCGPSLFSQALRIVIALSLLAFVWVNTLGNSPPITMNFFSNDYWIDTNVDTAMHDSNPCWWGLGSRVYLGSHYPHVSGGPEAMHQLHNALRELGFTSAFVGAFMDEYETKHSCPRSGVKFWDVRPGDWLLRGEGDRSGWLGIETDFRLRGGRTGMFFVGQVDTRPEQIFLDTHVGLCLNSYFKDMYGCAENAVANTPMGQEFFDAAARVSAVSSSSPSPRDNSEKLILLDNDFELDLTKLQVANRPDVTFKVLQGFNRAQMLQAYAEAAVMIDMYMPGAERAGYEASLFGTVVIVGDNGCGRDATCVPIPDSYRIGWEDYKALDKQLAYILDNYEQAQHDMEPLVRYVHNTVTDFAPHVFRTFHANVHVVASLVNQEDMDNAIPFCLSMLMLYPSASIQFLVPRRLHYFFEFQHAREIHELRRFGYWDMSGVVTLSALDDSIVEMAGHGVVFLESVAAMIAEHHSREFVLLAPRPTYLVVGQSIMTNLVPFMLGEQVSGGRFRHEILLPDMSYGSDVEAIVQGRSQPVFAHTQAWTSLFRKGVLASCNFGTVDADTTASASTVCRQDFSKMFTAIHSHPRTAVMPSHLPWDLNFLSMLSDPSTVTESATRQQLYHLKRIAGNIVWRGASHYMSKSVLNRVNNMLQRAQELNVGLSDVKDDPYASVEPTMKQCIRTAHQCGSDRNSRRLERARWK